ncbi:MAG TPA: creatininase family protein [Candidatus Acidoferrales bacterium]|nr:creatininase family protein [Candidatus Acidoferrales bacterium]
MSTADVRDWQYMTGRQFSELDRSRCVVTVACSPLEVHGPHLPVICDNLEASALTERSVALLHQRHPEIIVLRLPPIYSASDVLPHTGSLMFRPSTIVRQLTDLGRTLTKQGFKHIWVSSFHGGPRHFIAIEQASHLVNKRYGGKMVSLFSVLAKKLTEGTSNLSQVLAKIPGLNEEVLDGDVHGGAVETSLLLHLVGQHVDPVYKQCERMTVDLKLQREGRAPQASKPGRSSVRQLFQGFVSSLKYFETQTYAGAPAVASPEIGKQVLEILAESSVETLSDLWTGKLSPDDCHSPVWPVKWVFLSQTIGWLFERAVKFQNPIF